MSDPIGEAITRWFCCMGIPDPSEAERQVFMFYNSVIPDVEDTPTYVTYLASLIDQGETDRLSNMPALIWFHIALFKAATYEIEAGMNRATEALFPEALDGFRIDKAEFGMDVVTLAKTPVTGEFSTAH